MKGSRVPALLVGLTAALTLAACGVPPSGVIPAGEPASGMFAPAPNGGATADVFLYFLHDGELTPYPRRTTNHLGDIPAATVRLLFDGLTASENLTATTKLPRVAPLKIGEGGGYTLIIALPEGVPPLSALAMLQLECTVAGVPRISLPGGSDKTGAAGPLSPGAGQVSSPSVQVVGDGWTMTQSDDSSCPSPSPPQS